MTLLHLLLICHTCTKAAFQLPCLSIAPLQEGSSVLHWGGGRRSGAPSCTIAPSVKRREISSCRPAGAILKDDIYNALEVAGLAQALDITE